MCKKYNGRQAAAIVGCVKAHLPRKGFRFEEDHYAGYFDELAITVRVDEDIPENEIEKLAKRMLKELMKIDGKLNIEFEWMINLNQNTRGSWLLQNGFILGPEK